MTKLHKVRAHMRRSPKIERSSAFRAMHEALLKEVRQSKRYRVKAVSRRVAS